MGEIRSGVHSEYVSRILAHLWSSFFLFHRLHVTFNTRVSAVECGDHNEYHIERERKEDLNQTPTSACPTCLVPSTAKYRALIAITALLCSVKPSVTLSYWRSSPLLYIAYMAIAIFAETSDNIRSGTSLKADLGWTPAAKTREQGFRSWVHGHVSKVMRADAVNLEICQLLVQNTDYKTMQMCFIEKLAVAQLRSVKKFLPFIIT